MKLSNLKASLLAVVFALGINTTVQSMELHPQIESRGPGPVSHVPAPKIGGQAGVYHGGQSTHTSCDDDAFYSQPHHGPQRDDCGKRGGREKVVTREFIEIDTYRTKAPCQTKPTGCEREGLSLEEIIIAYGKQFHSCEEWIQIDAQRALVRYLRSGQEQAVLLSAMEFAKIIVETNTPHHTAPKPQIVTVREVLTGDYKLNVDTCILGNMLKRIEGSSSKPSALLAFFQTLNTAGIKFGLTATGTFSLTDDPCKPACANLCPPSADDCGCHKDGPAKSGGEKDDCKCHDKGSKLSQGDSEIIDLLIEKVGVFSHCASAKTILMTVYPFGLELHKTKITKMFSGSCQQK